MIKHAIIALALMGISHSSRAGAPDSTSTIITAPVDPATIARADAALDSARTAASHDRHHNAIIWYHRAITLNPSLAPELNLELGNQYTWADKPDSAVTFYRAHLATHPHDIDGEIGLGRALAWSGHLKDAIATYRQALAHAGDRENEVRIGLARAESWRDDHEAALREYNAVLAKDPKNVDARLGQAQVTNWMGRHRDASWMYKAIIKDHPDNLDAREGLAAAQYWAGRTDYAPQTLRTTKPTASATAFGNDVDRSLAPDLSYMYEQNKDSDDIKRRIHTVDVGFSPGHLTRLGAQYGHGTFEQQQRPDVTRDWLAATLTRRFNDIWSLHLAAGWQWNSYDRSQLNAKPYWKNEFNLFTIDGYATYSPRDWMRWDFGYFHGSLTNPDAIFRGITLDQLTAGLDWRFRSNLMNTSAADITFYSDANTRVGLGDRLVWQPLWRLPVRMNHRFTSSTGFGYFGFSKTDPDNGYYDPRQYWNVFEELALDMTFSKRARGHLSGRFGFDRENGGDWQNAGRFEVSGSFAVHPRLSLTAGYYNSNSRLDSREGYAADGFYVGLGYVHHE
jgi:tetratricopeptide (TPR) repeat protein